MREWDRSKHRPTLTFGSYVNFLLEDIVEICYQGIDIGDNNDPATENVPKETGTTASNKKLTYDPKVSVGRCLLLSHSRIPC